MKMSTWKGQKALPSTVRDDLIVCKRTGGVGIENRWASTGDIIDYTRVEIWNPKRWQTNSPYHLCLRRLKIYKLGQPTTLLLADLSDRNTLAQLEIDNLQLVRASAHIYTFKYLAIFCVDSVEVIDEIGTKLQQEPPAEERPVFELEANELGTAHLGKRHIKSSLD